MDRPHNRPRIEIRIPRPVDEVREAFLDRVAHPTCTCEGRFAKNHLHVEVGADRRHVWSPVLDVDVREEDGQTVLVGRFAPRPDLWTLYVFVYAFAGFVATVALCWWLAQLALDEPPTALWGLAAAAALAAVTWLTTRLGWRLGHDQMSDLYRMVDGLGDKVVDDAHVA